MCAADPLAVLGVLRGRHLIETTVYKASQGKVMLQVYQVDEIIYKSGLSINAAIATAIVFQIELTLGFILP